MPAHRAVLESENSSKADNARKNTAFPPVCKKCAEPQKKENPTRNPRCIIRQISKVRRIVIFIVSSQNTPLHTPHYLHTV